MSVTNEGSQDPLSSDIHVEPDKAHSSKVDEHEDVENLITNKQSSKVDAIVEIQRDVDIEKGTGIKKREREERDIQTDVGIQEKNESNQGSQDECAETKILSGDQLTTETESSNSQENVDKAGPQRVCYICKEIGHVASGCPLIGDIDSKYSLKKCFKCGVVGHTKTQCPLRYAGKESKVIRKMSVKVCTICLGVGHGPRSCPSNPKSRTQKCYKCRTFGHIAVDCPFSNIDDANNKESQVKCLICNDIGHKDYECPTEEMQDYSECSSSDTDDDSNDEGSDNKCSTCNGIGHKSSECPSQNNQKRTATNAMIEEDQIQHPLKKMRHGSEDQLKQRICFICHTDGHTPSACPNKRPRGTRKKICYACQEPGHTIHECPLTNTMSNKLQDRSRSRSPLQGGKGPTWLSAQNNVNPDNVYLFVGNLPVNWFVTKVRQFLSDRSKSSALMQSLKYITILKENHKPKGECVMEFTSANACLMAMKALRGADVEGKKIIAMPDSGAILARNKNVITNNDTGFRNNNIPNIQKKNAPIPSEPERNETYGLSVNFLESLNIQPPLRSRIFVGNLDNQVTESGLRELFSRAGLVLSVMIKRHNESKIMAKVEFDHPVEAVQAISMFNDRLYFEKKLLVKMDEKAHLKPALPPGLANIGPGLGPNGEPMRGVRHVVELEPIKQMLLEELNKLKSWKSKELQDEKDNMSSQVSAQADPTAALINNPNYQNTLTGMNNAFGMMGQSLSGLGLLGQMQTLQGLVQPNMGYAASITDLQAQMTPNVTQNYLGMANQMNVPQSQMTAAQSLIAMPQNQMNPLQNQMTVSPNPMNVSQNQTSELSKMSASQLINMSQNQLADSSKSKVTQDWSTGQKSDWSTPSQALSQSKEKKHYDDNGSTYSESSKYNNNKETRHSDTSRRESEEKNAMTSSDMLVFKNLPPSVTAKALKSKMREVGVLRYVEITGEGRAIVRFNEARDAACCLKLFDRSKVDGQTIFVNFF